MANTLQVIPKKTCGMHQGYSPWRKGTVFHTDWRRQSGWKTTWIKSPRNNFLWIIMIKINNECVSKCLLLCLEQTESKYDEALVQSDGLTKHSVLVMWKILEMKNNIVFFFCQMFCITLFTDSLLQNPTVGSWVYSQSNFVMLWCVWLSQYWIYHPYPQNPRMSEFVFSPLVTWCYGYKTS